MCLPVARDSALMQIYQYSQYLVRVAPVGLREMVGHICFDSKT